MTISEAVLILMRMQEPEIWEPQLTEEAFTALDMAIDALQEKQRLEDDRK